MASPPAPPPTTSSSARSAESLGHMVALGVAIAAPVVMLLPPRKLDLYTLTVAGCGVYSGNYLVRERNGGIGIMGLAGERLGFVQQQQQQQQDSSSYSSSSSTSSPYSSRSSMTTTTDAAKHARPGHESSSFERFSLPTERARSLHESMAADRAAAERRRAMYADLRARAGELARDGWGAGGDVRQALRTARTAVEADSRRYGWAAPAALEDETGHEKGRRADVLASAASARGARGGRNDGTAGAEGASQIGGVKGMVQKVWMGEETEGWKQRRMAEEQKALEEGKGYGDLIAEQIWEVWNWDKKRNEDGDLVPKEETENKSH